MNNKLLDLLLNSGVAVFNNFRLENKIESFEWKNVKFRGNDLSTANLSNGVFTNVKFDNVRAQGVNFSSAQFNKCQIKNSDFIQANFFESTINKLTVKSSAFEGNILNKSKISELVLYKCKADVSAFADSTFDKSYFVDTSLHGGDLVNCKFTKSIFYNCNLMGTKYQGLVVTQSKMKLCTFDSEFTNIVNFSETKVTKSTINSSSNDNIQKNE